MTGAYITETSKEERALANTLIEQKLLSVGQLQQGLEWCARKRKPLYSYLERFGTADSAPMQTPQSEADGPRVFVRHGAKRGLKIEVNAQLIEVRTLNVSRGGLAFTSPWAIEAGTEIKVSVEQKVRAVVRYCVDNGDNTATTGAEFAPKVVEDLRAIEALMSSLKDHAIGA